MFTVVEKGARGGGGGGGGGGRVVLRQTSSFLIAFPEEVEGSNINDYLPAKHETG